MTESYNTQIKREKRKEKVNLTKTNSRNSDVFHYLSLTKCWCFGWSARVKHKIRNVLRKIVSTLFTCPLYICVTVYMCDCGSVLEQRKKERTLVICVAITHYHYNYAHRCHQVHEISSFAFTMVNKSVPFLHKTCIELSQPMYAKHDKT